MSVNDLDVGIDPLFVDLFKNTVMLAVESAAVFIGQFQPKCSKWLGGLQKFHAFPVNEQLHYFLFLPRLILMFPEKDSAVFINA